MNFQAFRIPTVATIPYLHLLSMHNSLHLGLPLVRADVTSTFTPSPHASTYDSTTTETCVDTSTRPSFIISIFPTLRSLQRERTMERSKHEPNHPTPTQYLQHALSYCLRRLPTPTRGKLKATPTPSPRVSHALEKP
jgi:hypothetical protein